MDDEDYLKKIQQAPSLLVYFSYSECQVCRVLKPKVQELLNQYPLLKFLYIDINRYPRFKGEFLIFAVPTIVMFQKGRELHRFSRHISLRELEGYLGRVSQR